MSLLRLTVCVVLLIGVTSHLTEARSFFRPSSGDSNKPAVQQSYSFQIRPSASPAAGSRVAGSEESSEEESHVEGSNNEKDSEEEDKETEDEEGDGKKEDKELEEEDGESEKKEEETTDSSVKEGNDQENEEEEETNKEDKGQQTESTQQSSAITEEPATKMQPKMEAVTQKAERNETNTKSSEPEKSRAKVEETLKKEAIVVATKEMAQIGENKQVEPARRQTSSSSLKRKTMSVREKEIEQQLWAKSSPITTKAAVVSNQKVTPAGTSRLDSLPTVPFFHFFNRNNV